MAGICTLWEHPSSNANFRKKMPAKTSKLAWYYVADTGWSVVTTVGCHQRSTWPASLLNGLWLIGRLAYFLPAGLWWLVESCRLAIWLVLADWRSPMTQVTHLDAKDHIRLLTWQSVTGLARQTPAGLFLLRLLIVSFFGMCLAGEIKLLQPTMSNLLQPQIFEPETFVSATGALSTTSWKLTTLYKLSGSFSSTARSRSAYCQQLLVLLYKVKYYVLPSLLNTTKAIIVDRRLFHTLAGFCCFCLVSSLSRQFCCLDMRACLWNLLLSLDKRLWI